MGVAAVSLAAVALAGAGLTVGLLVSPEPGPSDVAQAYEGPRTVEVRQESFDDARQVPFTPVLGDAVELRVLDSGRVTAVECEPGGQIVSGSSPVTVDDRPVIALATSIPLWRDLGPGSRGADVSSLQEELARLGFDVDVSGVYGTATRNAVRDLFRGAGQARPDGRLTSDRVVWLPAAEAQISECLLAVGDHTTDGPLAALGAGVIGLQATSVGQGMVEGPRIVIFDGLTAPVVDGMVTDPALLAAVAASPWLTGDAATGAPLGFALAEPLDVTVVPPASLFDLADSAGCVSSEGHARAVTVVTSQLGRAFVTFDDGAPPPSSVDLEPTGTMSCR